MKFLLLLLATIVAQHTLLADRNPGVKVELTEKGLQFVSKIGVEKLSEDVKQTSFPVKTGRAGRLQYKISNVSIKEIENPTISVVADNVKGITVSVDNFDISLDGTWHWEWRWWKLSKRRTRSFKLLASPVTFEFSVDMGVDSDGRPTISLTERSSDVGTIQVKRFRGTRWARNIITNYAENEVKPKLHSKILEAIGDLVNVKAKDIVENMEVTVPVKDPFYLDYTLPSAPEIADDSVETLHKGECFHDNDTTVTPFFPPLMENFTDPSKEVTFCFSDYVTNSLGYVIYQRGDLLRYTVTKYDLPPTFYHYLNASNYPEIASAYPVDDIEVELYATEPPTLQTNSNGIQGIFTGTADIQIELPTGEQLILMETDLKLEVDVGTSMDEEKITGSVQQYQLISNIISANVSSDTQTELNSMLNVVFERFVVPKLNEIGNIGYPLPTLADMRYKQAQLHLMKDAFCYAADLKYTL